MMLQVFVPFDKRGGLVVQLEKRYIALPKVAEEREVPKCL